ncbi:polyprotein 1 [Chrysanthemum sadwavirus]|nr:polyprotein 1 [Chrysanthemum sadwavirus]
MFITSDCVDCIRHLLGAGYSSDEATEGYTLIKCNEIVAQAQNLKEAPPVEYRLPKPVFAFSFADDDWTTDAAEDPSLLVVRDLKTYIYSFEPVSAEEAEEFFKPRNGTPQVGGSSVPDPVKSAPIPPANEIIDCARDYAYQSPIFPLTEKKLSILRGDNFDLIYRMIDVCERVYHQRHHVVEEGPISWGALSGASNFVVQTTLSYFVGTSTFGSSIKNSALMLEKIFAKILSSLDFVTTAVESFSTFVNSLKDKVMNACKSVWEKMQEIGEHFFYLIPMFCCIFLVATTFFLLNKFLAVVAPQYCFSFGTIVQIIVVCCALVGFKELAEAILALNRAGKMQFLVAIFNVQGVDLTTESPREANNSPDDFDKVNATEENGVALGGFLGLLSFITFFAPQSLQGDLTSMSKWAHTFKNLGDGFDKFKSLSERFAFWVYEKVGVSLGTEAGAIQSMLLTAGIDFSSWYKEVERLDALMVSSVSLQKDIKHVRELYDQGSKLQDYMIRNEQSISFLMREKLRTSMKTLEGVLKKFTRALDTDGSRVCPFSVLFTGAPGVGKSSTMRGFIHDVLNEMDEPKFGRIYSRNPGDQYWSGYFRQTAVFYDDFAQKRPTQDHSDELELINLVSCNQFPLNCASLEDKGMTFASRYVFMCSNKADVSPGAGLADDNAFRRRRHLCVEVICNKEDFDPKCPHKNQAFRLLDPMKPNQTLSSVYGMDLESEGFLTYRELVALTVNKAQEHFSTEEATKNYADQKYEGSSDDESEKANEEGVGWACRFSAHVVPGLAISENFLELDHKHHEVYGVYKGSAFCCDSSGNKCEHPITDAEVIKMAMMNSIVSREDYDTALAYELAKHDKAITDIRAMRHLIKGFDKWDVPPIALHPDHQRVVDGLWADLSDRARFLICLCFDQEETRLEAMYRKIEQMKKEMATWSVVGYWDKIPFGMKWVVGIIAMFSAGYLLFNVTRKILSMRSWNPLDILAFMVGGGTIIGIQEGEHYSSGANENSKKHKKFKWNKAYQQGSGAEYTLSVNQEEKIRAIKRSQCILSCRLKNGGYGMIPVLMGMDHRIFLTTHELNLIDLLGSCYLFTRDDVSYQIFLDPERVYIGKKEGIEDAVASISISPFFSTPAACSRAMIFDYADKIEGRVTAFVVPHHKSGYDQNITVTTAERAVKPVDMYDDKQRFAWRAHRLIKCYCVHGVGLCGRLMLVTQKNGDLKVAAMHVGGQENERGEISYFGEFCIDDKKKPEEMAFQEGEVEVDFYEAEEPEHITEMVTKVGTVGREHRVRQVNNSAIEKSVIHDHLWREPETVPTIISARDPRSPGPFDPYEAGIRKFNKEVVVDFSEGSEESVVLRDIEDELLSHNPTRNFSLPTVLDDKTMINGADNVEYAERFVMGTSEGYPMILSRKHGETGKHRFFNQDTDGNYIMKDETRADVAEFEAIVAQEDCKEKIVTIACAKDEKTKKDKVYVKPKTRIFEILPFTYNLLVRKYYLFFMQYIMAMHNILPCKVGINCYSKDWDLMHGVHSRFGNHFNGDYSGFDTGTPRNLMIQIAEMVSNLANDGEKNRTIRRNLMRMAAERRILVGANVYEVRGGTPSGFALTVIINSIVNQFYLMLSWRRIVRPISPQMVPYRAMLAHVQMSVYGDDNVVSFSDQVRDYYNLQTIAHELSKINVTLSDGKKTGILEKWMTFDMLDFLKRKWVVTDLGGFLCPLDKVAIEERLFWIKKSEDVHESLEDNTYSALMEAFHHGPLYFAKLRGEIYAAYASAGIEAPRLMQYEDAKGIWLEQRHLDNKNDYLEGIGKDKLPSMVALNILRTVVPGIMYGSTKAWNTRKTKEPIHKVFIDPLMHGSEIDDRSHKNQINIPNINRDNFKKIIKSLAGALGGELCIISGDGGPHALAVALGIAMMRGMARAVALRKAYNLSRTETHMYTVQGFLSTLDF